MAKVRAYSYLRVSGKGQVRGDGFPRQREAVQRYARAHGIELAGEYRDEGVSGTKELEARRGLASLLDAVESNGTSLVLIERADRLARDLLVAEVILSQFRQAGVAVVATDSGIDLTTGDDDPTKKLIRQILGAVSEFEKSVIVLKLKAARERKKRQTGRCEGAKPYGHYPGEQHILARMHELHRKPRGGKRLGPHRIATILNREGLPSRSGKPWSGVSVKRILNRSRHPR